MDVLALKPNLLRLIAIRHLTREPIHRPHHGNISRIREFYLEFDPTNAPPETFNITTSNNVLTLPNCQYPLNNFPLYVKLIVLPKFRQKILKSTNMRKRLLNTITIIEDDGYFKTYWVFGHTKREDGPAVVWPKNVEKNKLTFF